MLLSRSMVSDAIKSDQIHTTDTQLVLGVFLGAVDDDTDWEEMKRISPSSTTHPSIQLTILSFFVFFFFFLNVSLIQHFKGRNVPVHIKVKTIFI